ncbi:MAG: hypothetical protein WB792_05155 [Desulfobacterales bacterium]
MGWSRRAGTTVSAGTGSGFISLDFLFENLPIHHMFDGSPVVGKRFVLAVGFDFPEQGPA